MPAARDLLTSAEGGLSAVRAAAARSPWRLGLFSLVTLAAAWSLLSTAGALNEFRDAHVIAHYEAAAAESVLRFHQAPLWDPYYCGGMYLLGTPQARFVSPTFFLTLFFGEPRGTAIASFAMMLLGLEGTFRYARSRGASALGAMLAAPIFALSGVFALAPALGWYNFFSFELLPWAAVATRRAIAGDKRSIVVAAVALAWSVGFGGTYTAPMAALWCVFEVVERVALVAWRRSERDPWRAFRPFYRGALVAVMALGLAAVRLWPIVDTLRAGQRLIGGTPAISWGDLLKMLFVPAQGDGTDGTFFIGWLALPAAAVGLARARVRGLAILGGLSYWLAAGYTPTPSLFALLRQLPVYSTLRYPERFLIFVALAVSVLAAAGFTFVERVALASRSRGRLGVAGVVYRAAPLLIAAALVASVGPLVSQHVAQAARRELAAAPLGLPHRPFHQARGNRWALAYYEPLDRGSLSCWDAYAVPESPRLRGDLTREEYLSDEGAGTVVERAWSPNEIDLDVALSRPSALYVNQNWNAGWRASTGTLRSEHGLLAVDLPAGTHTLTLRFMPRSAVGGVLVSVAAIGSLWVLGLRGRRRRFSRSRDALLVAGAIAAPCVCFALCVAFLRDAQGAAATATDPRDINGEPILADGLPDSAIRLDAKFGGGVTLEAATLNNPNPVAGQELVLELDWRRQEAIDHGLGVFVHIEFSKGKSTNGDHVLLSSVLAFDDAPANRTLRDIMPLFVPEDAAGKTVSVWVGLWHVRGDGARAHVLDAGHAIADKDRILAARFEVGAAEAK